MGATQTKSSSGPSRELSSEPVYSKTDQNGFCRLIFVMYHATDRGNVKSILDNGFRPSVGGMLGPGLYLSRDINKTRNYGDVCFKLLVYTGRTKRMDSADNGGSWRESNDSAYLPPHNDVVSSGREETCVKSVKQVKILGIAYGYDRSMAGYVRNLEGTDHKLDVEERKVLEKMVRGLYPWTRFIDRFGLPLMIAVDIAVSMGFWPQTLFDILVWVASYPIGMVGTMSWGLWTATMWLISWPLCIILPLWTTITSILSWPMGIVRTLTMFLWTPIALVLSWPMKIIWAIGMPLWAVVIWVFSWPHFVLSMQVCWKLFLVKYIRKL